MQVGRDLQKLSSPTSWSNKGQLWDQTWLLRGLFSQILKTFKGDDYTASLGSSPTSWLSSWGKWLSLHPVWISPVSIDIPFLLTSHHPLLWRSWLHFLGHLLVSSALRLLLGPLKPSLFQVEQAPFLQLPLTGQVLQPDCHGDILLTLLEFIDVFCSEEPKTCTI